MTLFFYLLSLDLAFGEADWKGSVCLASVPSPPAEAERVSKAAWREAVEAGKLPQLLIPLAWGTDSLIQPKGLWYDEAGRLHDMEQVGEALEAYERSRAYYVFYSTGAREAVAEARGRKMDAACDGTVVMANGRTGPACDPLVALFGQVDKSSLLAKYPGSDDWRQAQSDLHEARDALADRPSAFIASVCVYNHGHEQEAAARAEQEERFQLIQAMRESQPGSPPMSAWLATERAYGKLGLKPPSDSEVMVWDVEAFWAAVKGGETAEAVIARAKLALAEHPGSTFGELLAPSPAPP